jgi:hypothetical protein
VASGVGSYRGEVGDAEVGEIVKILPQSHLFRDLRITASGYCERLYTTAWNTNDPRRREIWGIVRDRIVVTLSRPGYGPGFWAFHYRVLVDNGMLLWVTGVQSLERTHDPFRRESFPRTRIVRLF